MKFKIGIIVAIIVIAAIGTVFWYSQKYSPLEELSKLNLYSKEEISFLNKEGFLDELEIRETPKNKEKTLSLIKPATLIEQNLNTENELFEVLAAKLDEKNYQLAFKLENKSEQEKEFYLIPVSDESQLVFQGIEGTVPLNKPLAELYDVNKHKAELRPELAKAYDDIENNNYQPSPVKITLKPKSTLIAKSQWQINGGPSSVGLKPVYLLVYGSAGGAKDELDKTKEYKNKWIGSYETLGFDTPDGDLDFGQYALDGSGTGYFIRTKPKNEAQFEHVDLTYDITGLTEVHISGKAYYNEFLTAKGAEALWGDSEDKTIPSGGIIRVPSNAKKYWDTAKIKDYPQPVRIEMVEELPPPEPPIELPTHHSIAFDATSNSGSKSSVSSYSWSHTCTGDNRLLVVGDSHRYGLSDTTVSSITFNADAMTSIRSDVVSTYYRSTLYYMVAPDTGGAYTVVVTYAGAATRASGGAISYTGAAQTGQPDANNGANGYSGTATVNVTTVADNSWVAAVFLNDGFGGTSTNTQRWTVSSSGITGAGGDTNGAKTPAGIQTMSWTWGSSTIWAISAASFAPAGEAPPAGSVKIKGGFNVKGGFKVKF